MTSFVEANPGSGGAKFATDQIAGIDYSKSKIIIGEDGAAVPVSSANPLPVSGPLTDAQMRATAVPVSGPATDAQLRATALPVSGPLTDAQMRAAPVPVSGPLTDAELRAASVPVSGPLTDTQLRATAVPVSGPLTDTQLRATAVPVSGPLTDQQLRDTALPVLVGASALPVGAAEEATLVALSNTVATQSTLVALSNKVPALISSVPDYNEAASPVRAVGQTASVLALSQSGASILPPELSTPVVGTGVTYSMANGAFAIAAGTTPNAEFLARSSFVREGSLRLRLSSTLSNRNANNNFLVLLADLVGAALAVTINSPTSITVATGSWFAVNAIGQSVFVGGIVGAAGVPGRYAITAVVPGVSITLAVVGWPSSGSCTATLFGHSYAKIHFTGATATAVNLNTQTRGWADADTVATINTTGAPGVIIDMELTGRECLWSDMSRAATATPSMTARASRSERLPDRSDRLHLFVWSFNGTAAPTASTWTIAFLSVENYAETPVFLQGSRTQGLVNPIPVQPLQPLGTTTVGGTVTSNIGTSGLSVFTDSSTNLGASAAFTGTSRDGGATPAFNLFVANAFADVAGTMRIEKSVDNATWRRATGDVPVAANVGLDLVVRVSARYYRVVFTNGAAAQAAFLLTSAYQRQ